MEKNVSKKEPKYVAFSTQKGGAGKTTLTVLVASYLHYVKGYNVAVIDCDYPQHSISEMRERDFAMVEKDEYYKGMLFEQFTRLGEKKAYPIIESNTKDALNDAEKLIRDGDYDFIFFDLPGTFDNPHLVLTVASMDYIISPIAADRLVLESTLNYLISVRDNIISTENQTLKGCISFGIWSMGGKIRPVRSVRSGYQGVGFSCSQNFHTRQQAISPRTVREP